MMWNWGTGIAIFFLGFIGLLVLVFIKASHIDNSLVMEAYYEEDLQYQKLYEKKMNTAGLSQKVHVETRRKSSEAILYFPLKDHQMLSGHIWLYNPASASSDRHIDIQADSAGRVVVHIPAGAPGRWKIKMDWMQGGTPYYQEEEIRL